MPWGTIRQHSTGATWEHSPKAMHDDRILGFLPSFGLKGSAGSDAKRDRAKKLSTSSTAPRGSSKSQPGFTVARPAPQAQVRRPATMIPPSSKSQRSSTKPPPRSMYDDPAFSADPRSHPHFSVHDVHSRNSQAHQTTGGSDRRDPALYLTATGGPNDFNDNETYALLSPPRPIPHTSSSHSSESATTTSTSNTSLFLANPTPPSSSSTHSNDHSQMFIKDMLVGPVNRPSSPVDPTRSNIPANPPPPYEESTLNSDFQEDIYRPNVHRGATAPELHHTPAPPVQLTRAATTPIHEASPIQAPPIQRRETSRQNPLRMRELDRIDELDETDPFGIAIHHRGPYEAIAQALGGGSANSGGNAGSAYDHGEQSQRKPRQKKVRSF